MNKLNANWKLSFVLVGMVVLQYFIDRYYGITLNLYSPYLDPISRENTFRTWGQFLLGGLYFLGLFYVFSGALSAVVYCYWAKTEKTIKSLSLWKIFFGILFLLFISRFFLTHLIYETMSSANGGVFWGYMYSPIGILMEIKWAMIEAVLQSGLVWAGFSLVFLSFKHKQIKEIQLVELQESDTTWALVGHIGGVILDLVSAGFIGLGVAVPLIILKTKGKKSLYVAGHALESVNFYITCFFWIVLIAGPLIVQMAAIFICYFYGVWGSHYFDSVQSGLFIVMFIVLVIGLVSIGLRVYAGIQAYNGKMYKYPFSIRLIKSK